MNKISGFKESESQGPRDPSKAAFVEALTDGKTLEEASLAAGISTSEGSKWLDDIQASKAFGLEGISQTLQEASRRAIEALEEIALGGEDERARVAAAASLVRMRIELHRMELKMPKKKTTPEGGQRTLWSFAKKA